MTGALDGVAVAAATGVPVVATIGAFDGVVVTATGEPVVETTGAFDGVADAAVTGEPVIAMTGALEGVAVAAATGEPVVTTIGALDGASDLAKTGAPVVATIGDVDGVSSAAAATGALVAATGDGDGADEVVATVTVGGSVTGEGVGTPVSSKTSAADGELVSWSTDGHPQVTRKSVPNRSSSLQNSSGINPPSPAILIRAHEAYHHTHFGEKRIHILQNNTLRTVPADATESGRSGLNSSGITTVAVGFESCQSVGQKEQPHLKQKEHNDELSTSMHWLTVHLTHCTLGPSNQRKHNQKSNAKLKPHRLIGFWENL